MRKWGKYGFPGAGAEMNSPFADTRNGLGGPGSERRFLAGVLSMYADSRGFATRSQAARWKKTSEKSVVRIAATVICFASAVLVFPLVM